VIIIFTIEIIQPPPIPWKALAMISISKLIEAKI